MKPSKYKVEQVSENWPANGLERVRLCPICGCVSRKLVYQGLRDKIVLSTPGEWTLYRCMDCGSGYLDPRPIRETINLAYRDYFTHAKAEGLLARPLRPFSRVFANGYRNWRYGTKAVPSSWLGVLVKAMQPAGRAKIEAEMRHLPQPREGAKLLDLGCGNGQFLSWARDMGWQVVGADPDPDAVALAKDQGIEVRLGGIEVFGNAEQQFDAITINHVIEHVHDPIAVLRDSHRLLKSNGMLWIDTPNLDSIGHAEFGSNWRGLEPPRHLVLFTRCSLRLALERAGFKNIRDLPFRPTCAELFAASEAIAEGRNPQTDQYLSIGGRKRAKRADCQEANNPTIREFITLKAWK